MKNNSLSFLISTLLIISGCNSNSNSSSNSLNTNSNSSTTLPNNDNVASTIIKSPNEDGGMEGNAENDKVKEQDETDLKVFLENVADVEYFTYEVTSKVVNNEAHFTQHFTPNAWYEENDNKTLSFGYAQEKDTNHVFKYYLDENNEVIPSIYEHEGQGTSIVKLSNLYDTWTITHVNMLKENMDEFSAKSLGLNKYVLTDSNTASIFQFMTTYGASITNYIVACYIEVINEEELTFKSTIDLGAYGSIEAIFTPKKKTMINFVDELVSEGLLKGVDYHQDIYDFLNVKMENNNFVLHGIKQRLNGMESQNIPYTIHCTNDYFYLEYEDSRYTNWGYILVPAYTEITYNNNGTFKTQTLEYTSCYKFKQSTNGSFVIDTFIGPISSDTKYKEVNELPATGDSNTIYIIEENGTKISYYFDNNTWNQYSQWYNSVGEFYINELGSTFYLSGGALSSIGSFYFEQSFENPNEYYSTSSEIFGALANGLFGWGFQQTNTWMEYIERAFITCNKDSSNNITSYDIGLDIQYFSNGTPAGIGQIYYTVDSFDNGNIETVDNFVNNILGGGNHE